MQHKLDLVQDSIGQVVELTWSYSLWWALVNKNDRTHNRSVIEAYPNYFRASVFALQQSFFISANRLFDEQPKSASLTKLVKDLSATNQVLYTALQRRLQAEEPTLQKILLLRHNVYGHRSKKISPGDAFKKAGIQPKEMKSVVGLAHEIVIELAVELGGLSRSVLEDKFKRCAEDVSDEARRIIDVLK